MCVKSRAEILSFDLKKTYKFLCIYSLAVTMSLRVFLACPFKLYFFDNELMALLPLEIIFIDQSTQIGFVAANFVMVILGGFAVLGTILYGASFICIVYVYALQIKLLKEDIRDLDSMWRDSSVVPLAYRHYFLRNICVKV